MTEETHSSCSKISNQEMESEPEEVWRFLREQLRERGEPGQEKHQEIRGGGRVREDGWDGRGGARRDACDGGGRVRRDAWDGEGRRGEDGWDGGEEKGEGKQHDLDGNRGP